MKHLSANRNLGYTIQPVLFEEFYFKLINTNDFINQMEKQ